MRFLFALLLFWFAHSPVFAQVVSNIYWTDKVENLGREVIHYDRSRALNWADFKGTVAGVGAEAALTASGFGYNLSTRTNGSSGQINISVYAYFDKRNSWVKPKVKSAYILNHEQRHFDITFLAAYDFMQRVKTLNLSPKNCNIVLQNIYKVFSQSLSKMQNDYDEQTQHGMNKAMQQKWDSFITERLNAIKD